MPHYATKDDIVSAYGIKTLIRISDNARSGQPDDEVIERGLSSADGIIDSYLEARFPLPLPRVPQVLVECAIDIAVYKIPLEQAQRTTEMRTRYEDALCLLDKIAAGKIGLGIGDTGSGMGTGPGGEYSSPSRSGRSINTTR